MYNNSFLKKDFLFDNAPLKKEPLFKDEFHINEPLIDDLPKKWEFDNSISPVRPLLNEIQPPVLLDKNDFRPEPLSVFKKEDTLFRELPGLNTQKLGTIDFNSGIVRNDFGTTVGIVQKDLLGSPSYFQAGSSNNGYYVPNDPFKVDKIK